MEISVHDSLLIRVTSVHQSSWEFVWGFGVCGLSITTVETGVAIGFDLKVSFNEFAQCGVFPMRRTQTSLKVQEGGVTTGRKERAIS